MSIQDLSKSILDASKNILELSEMKMGIQIVPGSERKLMPCLLYTSPSPRDS